MLNERKVKLMSQVSLFERREGKQIGKMKYENRETYVRATIHRNLPFGILTCALIYILLFLAIPVKIWEMINFIGIGWSVVLAVAVMALFVVGYSFLAGYLQGMHFDRIRGIIWIYNLNQKRLMDVEQKDTPKGSL